MGKAGLWLRMPELLPAPRPEILAPLGSPEAISAAIEGGADAVYFGLDEGFHARAKAHGFGLDNLAQVVAELHAKGIKVYLTTNTLVFEEELCEITELIRRVAVAGVDALIVQDPAVCAIVQKVAPSLTIHASTQMTISSPEAAEFAASLGVRRVVVPRELSLRQIERFRENSKLELEVFVHGALCMSWSGQCLSGEAWVGRSANRGQCNQGCRMPYELVVDGRVKDLGEERYLLSPKDLAATDEIDALVALGVASLKIEGRYKGAAYVRSNVELYRGLVDRSLNEEELEALKLESTMVYSRGFSPGHLQGSAHQDLVDGRFPKHRGAFLGVVKERRGSRVWVDCSRGDKGQPRLPQLSVRAPFGLSPGCGVVFDAGRPEDKDEAGGRVYGIEQAGAQQWILDLGKAAKGLAKVSRGDRVWLSAPPARRKRSGNSSRPSPHAMKVCVSGAQGHALKLVVHCESLKVEFCLESEMKLQAARSGSLDAPKIKEKLGHIPELGVEILEVDIHELQEGLFIPPSQLKKLRRALIARLHEEGAHQKQARVEDRRSAPQIVAELRARACPQESPLETAPQWVVLCRTMDQLQACIDAGIREVDLDWMEFIGLSTAVQHARAAGCTVNIATVRVQKPGEEGYDRRIEKLAPDGVLVRHFGALMHFAKLDPGVRPRLHGDFSLNVTNSITAQQLLALGLSTVTASHDLNDQQLASMMQACPALPLTLTLHHHLALFHNDHCVYAKYLSDGQDFRTCKRPCDRHKIHLRDHQQQEHPVIVDVECRNTVFSAKAQSAAAYLEQMRSRGIHRYRIEFAWEDYPDASRILQSYQALGRGEIGPQELTRTLEAIEGFGVTLGTLSNP